MALVSYSPATFDKLPDLGLAGEVFDQKNGYDLVSSFRELFLEHGMEKHLEAVNWVLAEDGLFRPFEFHYSPMKDANEESISPENPKVLAFVEALASRLRETDTVGLFGLCVYPGDDFEGRVEITEARANINLHPSDTVKAPTDMVGREAAWFFSPQLWENNKCACICGGNGHTSATHRGHVDTR
ncbi:Uu.00g128860.m01.CDS01 [Anthostomella pinea]|uniref:Uu.00g128860.m01.CDS01 n=1 Tax=Anthostomella pinea TaxID=933095 RepID=A0AAI8YI54_9PEZI|nr:Uu.00g128860.m01.CDS01 [Anthostomella pinea]